MLKSNLCDYSDAYIAVKGTIDFLADDASKTDKAEKNVFKNDVSFTSCIPEINSALTENVEDLNSADV